MPMEAAGDASLSPTSARVDPLESFPFPAIRVDADGGILHANRAACDLVARLGGTAPDLLLPLYHATYVAEARKRPDHAIAACTRAYGPMTVLQWSYRAAPDGTVSLFAADISGLSHLADHLAESQDRLLQSETLLRSFIAHVPVAVAMFDHQMRYLLASRKWHEDFDFLPDDVTGLGHYDLIAVDEVSRSRHRRALAGEASPTTEIVFTRPDSGAREWIATQALPWRREDGEIGGILIFSEIITARKIAEEARERRQTALRQQQKMEALGTLAGGIAHEIGSPIQYINDNLAFLDDAAGDLIGLIGTYRTVIEQSAISEDARRRIAAAEAAIDLSFLRRECAAAASQARGGIETVSRIVGAIKTFASPASEAPAPTDINSVIRDALLLSRNRWQPVAECRLDLEDTLPLVLAHADQLGQALLNIVVNAAQAIAEAERPQRGTITLRSRDRGSHVEITIADDGVGIAPQHLGRIFDPFFTTRPPGSGSGQGLSIAHAIVTRAHGGDLTCESEPEQGTRFTLALPYLGTPAESDR